MKPVYSLLLVFSLLLLTAFAWASPPSLTPISGDKFSAEAAAEIYPGTTKTFDLIYKQTEGDPPTSLKMVMDTPGGQVTVPTSVPGGDPAKGIPVTWTYTPESSGPYRFHFEATSSTGGFVRFPNSPDNDYSFVSVSLISRILVCTIGTLISLLFLPFVSYVATRSVNKLGDPAAAARISLLIGVVASLALIISVFSITNFQYIWLVWALAVVVILAIMVGLFSRRRVL